MSRYWQRHKVFSHAASKLLYLNFQSVLNLSKGFSIVIVLIRRIDQLRGEAVVEINIAKLSALDVVSWQRHGHQRLHLDGPITMRTSSTLSTSHQNQYLSPRRLALHWNPMGCFPCSIPQLASLSENIHR